MRQYRVWLTSNTIPILLAFPKSNTIVALLNYDSKFLITILRIMLGGDRVLLKNCVLLINFYVEKAFALLVIRLQSALTQLVSTSELA